jgi:hypothetical protein
MDSSIVGIASETHFQCLDLLVLRQTIIVLANTIMNACKYEAAVECEDDLPQSQLAALPMEFWWVYQRRCHKPVISLK